MKMSKFHELCGAYQKAQQDFQDYQNDCHQFALDFVKQFKEHFEIPPSQFSLFKINANNEFTLVQPSVINALVLRDDSLWQFGVGMTVCSAPETLPQELILIPILLRRDMDGTHYIKYGDMREFKIEKKDQYNFDEFFEFLFETIKDTYNQQLVQFIGHDTERKIGYN